MSQTAKDFSGQNLQGRNFKGQDLTGANFSYADIRGTNFSHATLRDASFTKARIGLPARWAIGLVLALLLLVLLAEMASASTGGFTWWRISSETFRINALIFSLFISSGLLSIHCVFLFKGLVVGSFVSASVLLGLGVIGALGNVFRLWQEALWYLWISAFAIGLLTAVCICSIIAISINTAGMINRSLPRFFLSWALFSGALGALIRVLGRGGVEPLLLEPIWNWNWAWVDLIWAWSWAWILAILGNHIAYKSLLGDKKFNTLYRVSAAILAVGGTSFRESDLTNATFTGAKLKGTDFRGAKLIRTCWKNVKNLEDIRFGNSYLKYVSIRKLLLTNDGSSQNFDTFNLEGIDLEGANLHDASFIGTNLNYANLRDTNLQRARLKQAQLDGTDLTGACLSGAFLEDWGITSDTELQGIRCEYIYMRVPTQDDPNPCRKPDNYNEVFEDGDFADFIRPLTDTLDLYHNQGVDPRAIAIAFKELAENNPEAELEIVAMEKRGRDKFLLRAKTAITADKSELSAEYFSTYNRVRGLSEAKVRALLAEKDSRIQSLEDMVVTALQRPSFYSHVERADMVSNNPDGISQSVSGGNVYGGMQAAQGDNNQQTMETNVAQSSTERQLSQADVVRMLTEIEQMIRDAELPTETKEEATLYLGAAKKAAEKEEPKKELAATNLKGMAETLENASKTTESAKKIWENIKPVLGQLLTWLGVAKAFFGF